MYSKLGQSSKMKLFAKIVTGFQPLTLFYKKLHPRCMTGFWITLLRKPMFKYSNKNNNRYIPVRSYFVYLLCAYPVSAGNTLFQRTVFETNSSNNADQCQIFISTFFLLFLPFQKFPITHFIRLFLTLPISLIFLPSRSPHILGSKYA